MSTPPASGRFQSFLQALATVLEMVKFEHTLFALPFAFLGMVMAAEGWPTGWQLLWVTVAMIGARSAAMGFNRLVDRHFDAANPRTAERALPAGQISPSAVAAFVVGSSGLLVLAAWQLNPLGLALSPLALAILFFYSYTKRFTWCAHLFLGLALAGAPVGGWIAVRADVTSTPLLLAAAVLLWVAGFDVLYALQDLDFDQRWGLHSIPSRFGVVTSLWISALFHLGMLGLLALLPTLYPPGLGTVFWVGWGGCAALLSYQHWTVRPRDLSRLNVAFFNANGALSVWLFVALAADIVSR